MANPEAIADSIREAVTTEFRGSLLARGQARSMIWRDGELPLDPPEFSSNLSYDLLSYGFALLVQGLQLLDAQSEPDAARVAFEHAASAIESVIAKGEHTPERDFHRLLAGAAYHLGGFSARAYSLLHTNLEDANLTPSEACLARLMLRDLDGVARDIASVRGSGSGSDDRLVAMLSERFPEGDAAPAEFDDEDSWEDSDEIDGEGPGDDVGGDDDPSEMLIRALDLALTDQFVVALSTAMLAFERGERPLLDAAIERLKIGLSGSGEANLVPQWWCHRLAIHLLDSLWDGSFHRRLPIEPEGSAGSDWVAMRELYIAVLYRRQRSEIELWPSQLEAAARAFDPSDNMVVALPTSAGKTRIAELCILACLAAGKRVMFVTPLRALSAQTEISLSRTFQPLGKSVSSLYGSIGVSDADENIMRDRDIIVATPEKLDFALRNEPSLLDNVGLVVLDEGHMIGLGEREVRYEVQIQRLLRRADADRRRIVCLSAILPDGDQLEDFTAWLTGDQADGLIKMDWRPTRLRYGEVVWDGRSAELKISVGGERPWVKNYILPVLPKGRKTRHFPCDQRELCLATAWKLMEDGQSVLIFCPQRRSVEPFAREIIKLHKSGTLPSVLEADESTLAVALAIGAEWLGADSAVLECLRLGVAVHHGALPTPYRKEIERLLRDGVLRLTISSPTLAQGLNLSATTVLFHSLSRNRGEIDISEFRNVVGRAGRAYVDVEGLALYPMFDDVIDRQAAWKKLVEDEGGKEMESGLLRLLLSLLVRMRKKFGRIDFESFLAYITGASAWNFPQVANERTRDTEVAAKNWNEWLPTLDTAILAMLGDHDVPDDEIEAKLDEVMASSLWARRIVRRSDQVQTLLKSALVARARHVWSNSTPVQRRGYFLAGVGLDTGRQLDSKAPELNALLVQANGHILSSNDDEAIAAITAFAEIVFNIGPFVPDPFPGNWKKILKAWLSGRPITAISGGQDETVLRFIENGLIYKLPWAMEATRVRALAHDDPVGDGITVADVELGVAVASVETGSLNQSAALLMRTGFSSRLAAIKAVADGAGAFATLRDLRRWIASDRVTALGTDPQWPSSETHALWLDFVTNLSPARWLRWTRQTGSFDVRWEDGVGPFAPTPLQISEGHSGEQLLLDAEHERCGNIVDLVNPKREGLLLVTASDTENEADFVYYGPKDLWLL